MRDGSSVDESMAFVDVEQQVRGIQVPEAFLGAPGNLTLIYDPSFLVYP
jgi:hypothetical protein